ncbi:MAG TPA: hypothetical protein VMT05_01110 [Terriglobales bacterium]|jgi:hypothetical protein|nr:hypothetical protein [Terriglobales bacterium]
MKKKEVFCFLAATMLALPAATQVGTPSKGTVASAQPSASSTAPGSPGNVSLLLLQIQSTARTTTADVSLLNVRKWKVSGDVKSDAETKAAAIQRNLSVALPTLLSQVQTSPNDFASNFKLYRNLGVLYDVISSLAESAGAFGPRNEFEPLASDLNRIDQARRTLGERLEALAIAKDAEIARLQDQVKAAQAAVPAKPKKIIVDEDDSAQKKPAKKTTKKKPPATVTTQASPSQASTPQ